LPPSRHVPAARARGPLRTALELLRRRALPATVGGCALLGLLVAAPAQAEEVFTGQAAAANAIDSTWIPAPARRAAVCIVDTGNDVTPDTANVVARFATDGGSGGDVSSQKHGTLMSMIAAAPYDGFGMVGAAPSIDVVSVRATSDGEGFEGNDLKAGIQLCVSYRNLYNVKVISLSLGAAYDAASGNATQIADTENMMDQARYYGLNVVAAAGNGGVATVDWPAGYASTFAVGAGDGSGVACSFASWGQEVDLWASGCPLDVARPDTTGRSAWAEGSSESTAFVAAVLTQLRGLDPTLTPDAAEQLLTSTARAKMAGPFLDIAAAFAADRLTAQLAAGHQAAPKVTPQSSGIGDTSTTRTPASVEVPVGLAAEVGAAVSPTRGAAPGKLDGLLLARRRLPRPVVRSLTFHRGVLKVSFRGKPPRVQARVQVYARRRGRPFPTLVRTLVVTGDRLRTRILGTVSQMSITYRDPRGAMETSASLSVCPRR
jgi:hypothetical protein